MRQSSPIQTDYKPAARLRSAARRYPVMLAIAPVAALVLVFFALQASGDRAPFPRIERELQLPDPRNDLPSLTAQPGAPVEADDDPATSVVTVRSGDSLARIFNRVGLTAADVHAVVNASRDTRRLNALQPGQQLSFTRGVDGELVRLEYAISDDETLAVRRDGSTYASEVIAHPLERRVKFAEGVVTTSLFDAGKAAGLSDGTIVYLANEIFGYDIDFVLDIRSGDRFMVLYEELYRDGERLRVGAILAAEFINQGRSVQAVRFVDDDGQADHYAPDGQRMRKAFRRVPMDVFRVSSHYNPNRRHPILNTIRAHRGVDYAAPTGTPIYAAGDGRVLRRTSNAGLGNHVELQHAGGITTLYAHMSRFARGVTAGTRVRQGQTIGYVGMTGLATGPHLHYEFRVGGRHVNPVTVALPNAAPLPAQYREHFARTSVPMLAHMQALSNQAPRMAAATQDGDDAG